MNYLTFFLGFVLFGLAVLDLLFTALSPTGAGFITGRLSKGLWKIFLFLSRKVGARRLLEMAGPLITGVLLINWLLLIWTACTIMIYSDEASVMNMETNTSASLISKIYFTGYTLSTMGNGDMEPGDGFWEFFTALFSFSGLILISIAISYLIPVLSAELEKRRLSVYITTLGCSATEIIENNWNGRDAKALEAHFGRLTPMIIAHAQNHSAYPILNFYHTSNKKEAFVLNLTNLDEAITLMLLHLPEVQRPSEAELYPLRKAISIYLITLKTAFIEDTSEVPPFPNLTNFAKLNIPHTHDQTQIARHYAQWKKRRSTLLGLIQDDGWQWEDLDAGAYDHTFDHH